jgi:hypothetical protein
MPETAPPKAARSALQGRVKQALAKKMTPSELPLKEQRKRVSAFLDRVDIERKGQRTVKAVEFLIKMRRGDV